MVSMSGQQKEGSTPAVAASQAFVVSLLKLSAPCKLILLFYMLNFEQYVPCTLCRHWYSPFCSSPGLKLSCSLAAAALGRTGGAGWEVGLHANVFSWMQFSEELLVQGHSGVMALICTWRI